MDLLISVNSVCGVTDGAPRELRRAGLGGVGRPPPTPTSPTPPTHACSALSLVYGAHGHTQPDSRVDTNHLQLLPLEVTSPQQGTGPTMHWLLLRDARHPKQSLL